ncbi:ATP-dependent DNA helicase PIF1-like protein [Tanacetum coccineum]|uniref:ATP-dependent DNA helicase PIF1-like protein n=1 Tax=Tanacetum coccineum TaxID=301880 RepID=A0ABQ5D2W8_9ASTR
MRLTVGARPEDVTELREFAEWILKVEDEDIGEHYDGEVCIYLPEEILLDAADDPAILAPMNEVVDNMNEHLLEKFQGEEMVYLSSDNVDKTKRHATIDQFIFSPELR